MYSVSGFAPADAASSSGRPRFNFWNPHASQRIRIVGIWVVAQTAPAAEERVEIHRTSTTGTAGSTVTPAIQNHSRRGVAPPAAPVLYLGNFTVNPTYEGDTLEDHAWGAIIGAPLPVLCAGIEVPPGSGLALRDSINNTADPACHVTVVWEEDW